MRKNLQSISWSLGAALMRMPASEQTLLYTSSTECMMEEGNIEFCIAGY
jgi:hypothetical protein